MSIIHETKAYRLETDRFGFYTLTRLSDGFDAFFQGDDASLWERNMASLLAIESRGGWRSTGSLDRSFDFLCSGYDEILQPPKAA